MKSQKTRMLSSIVSCLASPTAHLTKFWVKKIWGEIFFLSTQDGMKLWVGSCHGQPDDRQSRSLQRQGAAKNACWGVLAKSWLHETNKKVTETDRTGRSCMSFENELNFEEQIDEAETGNFSQQIFHKVDLGMQVPYPKSSFFQNSVSAKISQKGIFWGEQGSLEELESSFPKSLVTDMDKKCVIFEGLVLIGF